MAGADAGRVLPEGVREISGSDEAALLTEIEVGNIPKPELIGFNDWLRWRAGSGRRPKRALGDPGTTAPGQESVLWRRTMEAIHGGSWREDLAAAEEAAQVAAAEAEEATVEAEEGAAEEGRGLVLARASGPPAPGASPVQDTSSSAGSGAATPTGLKRLLEQEFDPNVEAREEWQARVMRAAMRMQQLGQALSEADIEKIVRKGKYCESLKGMDLRAQVSWLKREFGDVLLAEGMDEAEYNARLTALMEMLRARGTEVSQSAQRLFSAPRTGKGSQETSPDKGAGVLLSPPAEGQELASVPLLPGVGREGLPAAEPAQGALVEAILKQTETLAQALRGKQDQRHSVVKVSPTFKWPILGDDGPDAKEVEEFYEKYEDLCRLANDGKGMNPTEHLTTLLSCLRGSKEKIYKLVYKKHRKMGTLTEDPDKVFEEIRSRHMKFTETPTEKQMRVLAEWDGLWKGQKSAHQFEALFEEAITELELVGLGKNERELLLGYLQKVGPQHAADIQRDVRTWDNKDGTTTTRRAGTWEEAHRVLVELEGIRAGGRALQANYSLGAGATSPKGAQKGGGQKGDARSSKVCWEMRDKGTCSRGANCQFSHDEGVIAEARRQQQASRAGAVDQPAPAAVDAGKAKGKGKGKDGGKTGRGRGGKGGKDGKGRGGKDEPPKVSRVEFPDKVCWEFLKSRTCARGRECKFSHDLSHFDEQGRVKPKRSAPAPGAKGTGRTGDDGPAPVGMRPAPAGALQDGGGVPNPFQGSIRLCGQAHPREAGQWQGGPGAVGASEPPAPGAAKPGRRRKQATSEVQAGGTQRKSAGADARLTSLSQLPANWWTQMPQDLGGYQMLTHTWLLGRKVVTLLDYGAAVNAVTEELVVGCINAAKERGMRADDPAYPVVQLERFAAQETVSGIARNHPVNVVGAVVMRVQLSPPAGKAEPVVVLMRFKIFQAGTSDWHGFIFGARALDTPGRGGLGLRVLDSAFVLETYGLTLPRMEEDLQPRRDEALMIGPPVAVGRSVVDSDDEDGAPPPEEPIGAVGAARVARGVPSEADALVYEGEPFSLEPGDGAWVPVRRAGGRKQRSRTDQEVVLQPAGSAIEVAPGLWQAGSNEGAVFVANVTEFDQDVGTGEVVGAVASAAVQTEVCEGCGATETSAWLGGPEEPRCGCGALRGGPPRSCQCCGAGQEEQHVWPYAGCGACSERGSEEARGRTAVGAHGPPARGAAAARPRPRPPVPRRKAVGYVGRTLWLIGSTVAWVAGLARDVAKHPIYHIVEEPGAVERMAEVEVPTEEYYQALRRDLGERYAQASVHVLDHLLSVEAFLDVSILSGFSFGVDKAQVLKAEGKLLGRVVGRDGVRADGERVQAIKDFAPLKEKLHVQQFAGSTNWLRQHMKAEYGQAMKVLGEYMKPGAVFPSEGLGAGTTPGDLAVKAIKLMACDLIELAVLDEAAAVDGSRPLEQIADSSGIAWGGTCLQMTKDLGGFNVLMTVSKGLTPAQQAWPPLTLEGYAQLETKRAQRRTLGSMRSICWTDHANWTRQLVLEDVDVKHLRWVSWIIADGSQIRSLSGRTAKLGDGFSRNPAGRDELLAQRTKDLEGRTGQLRGFSLEEFLSDYEQGGHAYPWSVADDAVPTEEGGAAIRGGQAERARGSPAARAAAAVGVKMRWRTLYVAGAEEKNSKEKKRGALEVVLRKLLPEYEHDTRAVGGPFEDDVAGVESHFERGKAALTPQKLVLETKRDGLTAVVTLARHVAKFVPDLVVGEGQGGLVAGLLVKPALLEVALQARNVQREEVWQVVEAWARLKGVVLMQPRLGRASVGLELVEKAFPESFDLGYPVAGPWSACVLAGAEPLYDATKALCAKWGTEVLRAWGDVDWQELVDRRPIEVWNHEGICSCGRRTYLFGQCARCLKEAAGAGLQAAMEAAEEPPPEVAAVRPVGPVAYVARRAVELELAGESSGGSWRPSVSGLQGVDVRVVPWGANGVELPEGPVRTKPYRLSFLVLPGEAVAPLQQCVDWRFETVHGVYPDSWPRYAKPMGLGTSWPELQKGLELARAAQSTLKAGGSAKMGPSGVVQEMFALLGFVERAEIVRGPAPARGAEVPGAAQVCYQREPDGRWQLLRARQKGWPVTEGHWLVRVEIRAADECRRAAQERGKVVCFAGSVWMHYDYLGLLGTGGQRQGSRGHGAAGACGPPAACAGEDAAPVAAELRRVPWQTPHTFDKDGELRLTEAAEDWLQQAARNRERLADEARADAGQSDWRLTSTIRRRMLLDQEKDAAVQGCLKEDWARRAPTDQVIEGRIPGAAGEDCWVPIVPDGTAVGHVTWKKWIFVQAHVGVFGGHRLADQTVGILKRLVWWRGMRADVDKWVSQCLVCLRFRKRPTKALSTGSKRADVDCWEEVMVDMEGPSNPSDAAGNRYTLTYICCLCHGVLLEPCRDLKHGEVRRAFARCVFRAGTLPRLVRSDRGVEFRSVLMQEFVALLGARQRFGTAWRPAEQGIVERSHQELQKILGMLVSDVLKAYPEEWTELLPVVEFLIYTTPGPHGYTPRDLDRHWSLAIPLEKDLSPAGGPDEQLVSDYARGLFRTYRQLRAKVTGWYAATSDRRAELANRWRKEKHVEVGDKVVYRDPRAKAVGGRTPWKEPLSDPCVVESRTGNRVGLRRLDGTSVEAHVEDVVRVPEDARDYEREPLDLDGEGEGRRSVGEMLEAAGRGQEGRGACGPPTPGASASPALRNKVSVGCYVAYVTRTAGKICSVGRVVSLVPPKDSAVVHRHRPVMDGRLRLHWKPLFVSSVEEGGEEGLTGASPCTYTVELKAVLGIVQLHDGVLSHAAARRLDRAGWQFEAVAAVDMMVPAAPSDEVAERLEELASRGRLELSVRAGAAAAAAPRVLDFGSSAALQKWAAEGYVDFLEVYGGLGRVTARVRAAGLRAAEGIDHRMVSYDQTWRLETAEAREALAWLVCVGLRPRAIHEGIPVAPKNHRSALEEMTLLVAEHQCRAGLLVSVELPAGAGTCNQMDWKTLFGTPDAPRAPWIFVKSAGCQFGLRCPGEAASGTNMDGLAVLGRPMLREQIWAANFDIAALGRGCRDPRAIAGATHDHLHARGMARLPAGGWVSLAEHSGQYTPEQADVYARCLSLALAAPELQRRQSGAVGSRLERECRDRTNGPAAGEPWCPAGPRHPARAGAVLSAKSELDGQGSASTAADAELEGEAAGARRAREDVLRQDAAKAERLWSERAKGKCWDEVRHNLEVYRYSGQEVNEDPRRSEEYRRKVLEGLGFGADAAEKHPELSSEELAAAREVLSRKAAAFWLEGTPRTTVRFVMHDTVPTGPPVKVPPHNLKGEAADWVDQKLQDEVARGQLERGTSAWGSPPFPTKEFAEHRKQRKRRIVVDYRRVNARTLRSVYFVRSAAGVVADAAGSIWMTLLDAVTGFNHIINTERARQMLAILARSGQFLPRCLTFGPHNGPEDFCYVIDRFYSPGRKGKMRFCKEWLGYVDDLTIRTGRVLDGVWYTDDEYDARIKDAVKRAEAIDYQPMEEALEAQGFQPRGLGEERPATAKGGPGPGPRPGAGGVNRPRARGPQLGLTGRALPLSLGNAQEVGLGGGAMPGPPMRRPAADQGLQERVEAERARQARLRGDIASYTREAGSSGSGAAAQRPESRGRVAEGARGPPAPAAAKAKAKRGSSGPPPKWIRASHGRWVKVHDAGKAVVTLLRHDNGREVKDLMDTAGWVRATDILACRSVRGFGMELDDLKLLLDVENEGKVRFQVHEERGELFVRAAQGHSEGVSRRLDMGQVMPVIGPGDEGWVDEGLHGTKEAALASIIRVGLDTKFSRGREKRTHLHFVTQIEDEPEQAGLRSGSEVVVVADLKGLHEAGAIIHRSANGVLLTAGFGGCVPPQYLLRMERLADGRVLWPLELGPKDVTAALAWERRETIELARATVAAAALEADDEWPLAACFPSAAEEELAREESVIRPRTEPQDVLMEVRKELVRRGEDPAEIVHSGVTIAIADDQERRALQRTVEVLPHEVRDLLEKGHVLVVDDESGDEAEAEDPSWPAQVRAKEEDSDSEESAPDWEGSEPEQEGGPEARGPSAVGSYGSPAPGAAEALPKKMPARRPASPPGDAAASGSKGRPATPKRRLRTKTQDEGLLSRMDRTESVADAVVEAVPREDFSVPEGRAEDAVVVPAPTGRKCLNCKGDVALGSGKACHWCHAWCHHECLMPCSADECGWLYCESCEPLHTHPPRLARAKIDVEARRQPEDVMRAELDARVAELDEVSAAVLARGASSTEERAFLRTARATETAFTRAARAQAGASLTDKIRGQASVLDAAEDDAARDPEAAGSADPERLRELEVAHSANLEKLVEHRERVQMVRMQNDHPQAKRRSHRFLAEVRAIQRGESRLTIWQSLQREKQYQRNRARRLDMAAAAVMGGMPLPEDREFDWPEGSWSCGLCSHKNGPNEDFCQGCPKPGVRCSGTWTTPGSKVFKPWIVGKPRHLAHRPPSHVYRSSRRSAEAKKRQRTAHQERESSAKQRRAEEASWKCPRCEAQNIIWRWKCMRCSYEPADRRDWDRIEMVNPEVWFEAGGVAPDEGAGSTKPRKRGGKKHRGGGGDGPHAEAEARGQRAVGAYGAPAAGAGERRKETKGESAAGGRSRAAGSGAMRHPIAHDAAWRCASGALLAAMGWEIWGLTGTARQAVEKVLVAVADETAGLAENLGATASAAGSCLRDYVQLLARIASWAEHLLYEAQAGLTALWRDTVWLARCAVPVFLLAVACRLAWARTAKEALAEAGFNPEGNVSAAEGIRKRLEEAFGRASADGPEKVPWLDSADVAAQVRNPAGMRQLVGQRFVRPQGGGVFLVTGSADSRGVRKEYQVELEALRPTANLKSLVKSCTCMDHVGRGPICKHAGLVLWEMAGAASEQRRAIEGGDVNGASAMQEPSGSGCGPVAVGACGAPAPGAPKADRDRAAFEKLRQKAASLKAAEEAKAASGAAQTPQKRASARAKSAGASPATGAVDALIADFSGLRLSEPNAEERQREEEPDLGKVVRILDALSSQAEVIRLLKAAGRFAILMAFTYDRTDITQALIEAKGRGVDVVVGVDRRWTVAGKTRDQLQRLTEVAAAGIEVKVLTGRNYASEYRQVGRAPYNAMALSHAKVLHTDKGTVVGSCNWTTASRANVEVGLLVRMTADGEQAMSQRLRQEISMGTVLKDAAVLAAQEAAIGT